MRALEYGEVQPSRRLADFVECFWTIRSSSPLAGARLHRVLPDGCSDIIFNLGDPPAPADRPQDHLRSYVVGAMRRPITVAHMGSVDLVGVRFRPGGATPFVTAPARELTDEVVALSDFWRQSAADAESVIVDAPVESRTHRLEGILLRRLAGDSDVAATVKGARGIIARSHGRISIQALSDSLGVSRRQLERLFADTIGLTPKMACRVARFRCAIETLRRQPEIAWTRLAYVCGYYDQAHLVREFKVLAGVTPSAYRRERAGVAFVQDTAVTRR